MYYLVTTIWNLQTMFYKNDMERTRKIPEHKQITGKKTIHQEVTFNNKHLKKIKPQFTIKAKWIKIQRTASLLAWLYSTKNTFCQRNESGSGRNQNNLLVVYYLIVWNVLLSRSPNCCISLLKGNIN